MMRTCGITSCTGIRYRGYKWRVGKSEPAKLFADLQNEMKEKFLAINPDAQSKIFCFEVVAIGSVLRIKGDHRA